MGNNKKRFEQRWSRGHRARGQDQGLGHKKKSEAKAKAKDSLSENKTSRGQGQECSRPRPRTKDIGVSDLQKKRSSKIFFRRSPIYWRTPEFLVGEAKTTNHMKLRHQNFSKEEVFVGQRYRRMENLKSLLLVCM